MICNFVFLSVRNAKQFASICDYAYITQLNLLSNVKVLKYVFDDFDAPL